MYAVCCQQGIPLEEDEADQLDEPGQHCNCEQAA